MKTLFHFLAKKLIPNKGAASILISGLVISSFFLLLSLYNPVSISFFEQKTYDLMHAHLTSQGKPEPLIVDIDEKSLKEIGQWPWPRYHMAKLLDEIIKAEPSSVGIDIVFAEPDRTSLSFVLKELYLRTGIKYPLETIPEPLHDNDLLLAKTLPQGPFVMSYKFLTQNDNKKLPPGPVPVETFIVSKNNTKVDFQHFPEWKKIIAPIPTLAKACRNSGFVNILPDNDGIIRQIPMITKYEKYFFPSLSLASVMQKLGTKKIALYTNPYGLEAIRIKDTLIPVMPNGNMLLHYRAKGENFESISASHILNNRIDKNRLNKKIIFIGTSASGLRDEHSTPISRVFPGVKIHATAADNIINKNLISRPPWDRAVKFCLTGLIGILSALMLAAMSPLLCMISLFFLAFAILYTEFLALQKAHISISMFYPFLTLTANFSCLSFIRFRIGEKIIFTRTKKMVSAQNLTIIGITSLAAKRDKETGLHIRRTAVFVKILAQRLSLSPDYEDQLDDYTIEVLYKSAPMHDIGKVAIPDSVLLKPGKLTEKEFNIIKHHTNYGWEAINEAEKESGIDSDSSFLKLSKEIILSHHEKWDGSGYNQGLEGTHIPLSARLMAVADVYDALTSKRAYKKAFTHEKAKQIILEGRGTHFDPDVVDAFLEDEAIFEEIAIRLSD